MIMIIMMIIIVNDNYNNDDDDDIGNNKNSMMLLMMMVIMVIVVIILLIIKTNMIMMIVMTIPVICGIMQLCAFALCWYREVLGDELLQRVAGPEAGHVVCRGVCQPQQALLVPHLPQRATGGLHQLQPPGPVELWLSDG